MLAEILAGLERRYQAWGEVLGDTDPEPVDLRALVLVKERQAFDMRRFVRGLVDEDSFFEIHALWAREVVTGSPDWPGRSSG